MVVDWYKDEQPRHQVFALIQTSLNEDLPMSYDRVSFNDKTHLLFNHFAKFIIINRTIRMKRGDNRYSGTFKNCHINLLASRPAALLSNRFYIELS